MVRTVEQDLGLRIAHYVEVSFQGVVGIVNALGGVRMDFPYPSRDTMSGLFVPQAGCTTLDGTQALALVRSRSFSYEEGGTWRYDGTGAFGRIRRQQAFLRSVVHRVEGSLLTDPLRLNAFIGATVHDVTVDQGLGVSNILQLANALRHLGSKGLSTFTLPTQIVNNDGPYGDVLYPVPNLDAATIAQWRAAADATTTAGSGSAGSGSNGSGSVATGSGSAGGSAASATSGAGGTSTGSGASPAGNPTSIATPPPPQATPGSVAIVSGSLPFNPTPC
jgi:LCP family protein required for cell wall assembly